MRAAGLLPISLLSLWVPFGASCAPSSAPAPEPARVWMEDVVIPTYRLLPDDLNPHFFELGGSVIYPYTMQDGFSSERVDRTYRAVFVENEYLRVMCLPEIGGRIQSVWDKVHGEEMFYRNHVIRPGHIALRGAWVSGGIEWNRGPQGHTVTSFSPVDVRAVVNGDGSASLVIGNTEQNFRTGWTVRLTLHPGQALLDERIELFNPTDGVHPYYFWNNTAFPNRSGTRFIYPMTLGTDHNGENFFHWPVHEGRDLTWLENYPGPTSVFGYQVTFDFFGAYDVDRDYGIVQVADHRTLPGKKAWTWGESDAGHAAQSVLTEDDGPYIEVQSGPLPTQADFEMLQPGDRVAWQELWYPAAGLGEGFEYATRDVVVARRTNQAPGPDEGVEFRFMSNASFPQASFEIRRRAGPVLARSADLEAGRATSFPVPIGADESVEVVVTGADGRTLLDYESPLPIPDFRPPPAAPGPAAPASPDRLYAEAFDLDKQGDRAQARRLYERLLATAPDHVPARVAVAVLDLEAGRFADAERRLDEVLERQPELSLPTYLRGAVRLRRGDLEGAARDARGALPSPETESLAHDLLGRVSMREGHPEDAVGHFEAASRAPGAARRAAEHLLMATYAAGDLARARSLAEAAVSGGTIRLVPHAISALASSDASLADAARRFGKTASAWVGEPEFAFMELTFAFVDLGMLDEAAALLNATLIDGDTPPRPLGRYTAAWLAARQGHDADVARLLAAAADTDADYVFPSRVEMIEVLAEALHKNPLDGAAHLYLGNLLAGLGRIDEAVPHWRRAVQIDATLAVADRNLGLVARLRDHDLAAAAAAYTAAIGASPDDQTLYRDLASILVEQGAADRAINLLEGAPTSPHPRADVIVLLAGTYLGERRFDEAIELLDSTTFSNREGDAGTWRIFSRAHVERGIQYLRSDAVAPALDDFETALTYPSNLNAGRPHEPREARAQYWRGRALAAAGRAREAVAAWRACADALPLDADQVEHIALCEAELH